MPVAYVLDDVFLDHRPPGAHPERPERVAAVRDALGDMGLFQRGRQVAARRAQEAEIGLVHTAGYVSDLLRTVPGQSGWLDADTYFSPGTWDAALSAAAAGIDLVRAALSGEHPRGVALVRPPGHHAEADRAMGFCIINNVAVAARAAREAGAARVAVIDWDVHHGNGTQHIFEEDPHVLFVSLHQYPFYPGTGAAHDVGTGAGVGTTLNIPLPAGAGDAEYLAAFDRVVAPSVRRFSPDVILASAGFDAFRDDPLAQMELSLDGFAGMSRRLVHLADELCEGRLVALLEGGYDLVGVAGGAQAVVSAMESPGARPAVCAGEVAGPAERVIAASESRVGAVPEKTEGDSQ